MKLLTDAKCPNCGRVMEVNTNTFTEGPDRHATLITVEYKCLCGHTLVKPLYSR